MAVATRIGDLAVRNARLQVSLAIIQFITSPGWNLQRILAFDLGTIRVDGSAWKTHVEQVVINEIGLFLGVDKDQGTRGRHRDQQVVKALHFDGSLGPDDL
jgi:hypothetical protein